MLGMANSPPWINWARKGSWCLDDDVTTRWRLALWLHYSCQTFSSQWNMQKQKSFQNFPETTFWLCNFRGLFWSQCWFLPKPFFKQQCDQHISTSSGYCVCADVLQMCANSNKLFTTIRLHNVQLVSAIRLRWMSNNKIKRPTEIKITSLDSIKVLGIIV